MEVRMDRSGEVMTNPQADNSRIGRFRDALAYRICNFALNHVATPWYAGMISGSIRLGLDAAVEESKHKDKEELS